MGSGPTDVRYCSAVDREGGPLPFKEGPLPEDEDEVAFEWPSAPGARKTGPGSDDVEADEELTRAASWDELVEERPPEPPAFLQQEAAAPEQATPVAPPAPSYAPTQQAAPAPAPPPAQPPPAGYPPAPGRMESLQAALAGIRNRVQSLSSEVGTGGQPPHAGMSPLDLTRYRQASEERTLAEVRRHSRETEDLLQRMSGNMQDLSTDLRGIVDAARLAIDQTSEQAESSIELGRLLGGRLEQLDEQVGARFDQIDEDLAARIDLVEGKVEKRVERMQAHVDKRLTKIEQRAGVGILREEVGEVQGGLVDLHGGLSELHGDLGNLHGELGNLHGELGNLRSDLGSLRGELGELRSDLGVLSTGLGGLSTELATLRDELADAVAASSNQELQLGLQQVNHQLNQTLASLAALVEGAPEQDEAVVEEVVSAIKLETEAAVEPFRVEVEELGRQLGEALGREDDLSQVLGTLTEEVQRLRRRISVRAEPASIDDEQLQTIVDAVVTALPAAPAPSSRPRPARFVHEDEPEDEEEAEEPEEPEAPEDFDEPEEPEEPEEAPPPRKLTRKRPVAKPTPAKGNRPLVKARKAGSRTRRTTR